MKCPICESCEYEQYCGATEIMRKCERHNKKVPMTNEDWLHTLNTEQLAECITNISFNTGYDSYNVVLQKICEWLKQPYSPK